MATETLITFISLLLGLASGAIMHRSDFCIAGMFRDLFLFRYSPQLPSLILLIAVSMLLFEGAQLAGLLSDNLAAILFGAPALTNIPGGILFGIGMVLRRWHPLQTRYRQPDGGRRPVGTGDRQYPLRRIPSPMATTGDRHPPGRVRNPAAITRHKPCPGGPDGPYHAGYYSLPLAARRTTAAPQRC